jgi:hypothetical protein
MLAASSLVPRANVSSRGFQQNVEAKIMTSGRTRGGHVLHSKAEHNFLRFY